MQVGSCAAVVGGSCGELSPCFPQDACFGVAVGVAVVVVVGPLPHPPRPARFVPLLPLEAVRCTAACVSDVAMRMRLANAVALPRRRPPQARMPDACVDWSDVTFPKVSRRFKRDVRLVGKVTAVLTFPLLIAVVRGLFVHQATALFAVRTRAHAVMPRPPRMPRSHFACFLFKRL
jgi:hypothetical protein